MGYGTDSKVMGAKGKFNTHNKKFEAQLKKAPFLGASWPPPTLSVALINGCLEPHLFSLLVISRKTHDRFKVHSADIVIVALKSNRFDL